MAMTNIGGNGPLIMLPDDGAGSLQPLALPPPGCCSAEAWDSRCTQRVGYSRCTQHGALMGPMIRLAYPLPEAARIAGVSRTRIFEAVRKQELTIRKAGRA